jgi:trans-aconitate methyltransferase
MLSGCLEESVYFHVDLIIDQFKHLGIEDALVKGPVLDVGCGPAEFNNMLRFKYPDSVLVNADFSHEMLLEGASLPR